MNYATIRPTLKSGDLIAQSHRAPFWKSWYDFKIAMVRCFTQSEFSHVAICWVIAERVFILEAVSKGVRIFPLSRAGDFYHLPLPVKWTEFSEAYALSHVGDRYSQIEAILAYFGPVDEMKDVWECAQYALCILEQAGVQLGNVATPTAVVRAAQLSGAPCILVTNP
jgi:hypothetical protein